jgi:hypothetical protein
MVAGFQPSGAAYVPAAPSSNNVAVWMPPVQQMYAAAAAASSTPGDVTIAQQQEQQQQQQQPRPTYVNAKQYRRILKRRDARARLEEYYRQKRTLARDADGTTSNRKRYQHKSRHLHAVKRPRGPGGRFLTKVCMFFVICAS